MRTFFAVDDGSRIKASTMRKLLELSSYRQSYELLRLDDGRFPCLRSDHEHLVEYAAREGEKIYDHYEGVRLCVIIFGADMHAAHSTNMLPVEYALLMGPDKAWTCEVLNSQAEPNLYLQSSPDLQPALTDAVIDLAELWYPR